MIQLDAHKSVHFCDGLKRRDFLQAGALSLLGLTLSDVFALRAAAQTAPGNAHPTRTASSSSSSARPASSTPGT
jgi:hypothetical protein